MSFASPHAPYDESEDPESIAQLNAPPTLLNGQPFAPDAPPNPGFWHGYRDAFDSAIILRDEAKRRHERLNDMYQRLPCYQPAPDHATQDEKRANFLAASRWEQVILACHKFLIEAEEQILKIVLAGDCRNERGIEYEAGKRLNPESFGMLYGDRLYLALREYDDDATSDMTLRVFPFGSMVVLDGLPGADDESPPTRGRANLLPIGDLTWCVTHRDTLHYHSLPDRDTLAGIIANETAGKVTEEVVIWRGGRVAAVVQAQPDGTGKAVLF